MKRSLEELAAERGLAVVDRGNGHIQLTGGPLLVNYYPTSKRRSAYVAGTTRRYEHVLPESAVAMCFNPPGVRRALNATRKGNYRSIRRKMMHGQSEVKCHWCPTMITLNTSTLDHVIPLFKGGLDNANNRVLACEPCNNKRGHDMPELQEAIR
jgi:5-methylcytosine-specific restriction endonuclease McrA